MSTKSLANKYITVHAKADKNSEKLRVMSQVLDINTYIITVHTKR